MGIKVEGLRDLEETLESLSLSTRKRAVRRGMTTALEPVAAAARAGAPRSDGDGKHMADSIGVSNKLTKAQAREARGQREGRHVMLMYVGPKEPHAHLVEFGSGPRYHKKSGKFVGAMPPSPFMRPAWDGNRQAVLDSLAASVWADIEKVLARQSRRAARAARG
jgi:HK97 gp10 family phage protein